MHTVVQTIKNKKSTQPPNHHADERDNLAVIASQFICHRLGLGTHHLTFPDGQSESTILEKVKSFVLRILYDIDPKEDAVFGALMIFERTRNIRPEFFAPVTAQSVVCSAKLFFASSLGVAVNVMAGLHPPEQQVYTKTNTNVYMDTGRYSRGDEQQRWEDTRSNIWKSAKHFEEDYMFEKELSDQIHEAWLLYALNGDIFFVKKMFTTFKKTIIKDFGRDQGPKFPDYPRSFVTERPVFLRKRY